MSNPAGHKKLAPDQPIPACVHSLFFGNIVKLKGLYSEKDSEYEFCEHPEEQPTVLYRIKWTAEDVTRCLKIAMKGPLAAITNELDRTTPDMSVVFIGELSPYLNAFLSEAGRGSGYFISSYDNGYVRSSSLVHLPPANRLPLGPRSSAERRRVLS